MGSEVDVDQSMNLSSGTAFHDGYKSVSLVNNSRIELETNDDNISDSGTDSFSEQMVRYRDSWAAKYAPNSKQVFWEEESRY